MRIGHDVMSALGKHTKEITEKGVGSWIPFMVMRSTII